MLDGLRPIVTGVLAALLFAAIAPLLLRRIPREVHARPVDELIEENRSVIRVANTLSATGVISAFVMYLGFGFAENDWRPLGVGLGWAVCAPVATVHIAALLLKRNVREVVVAYATRQKLPLGLLYPVSGIAGVVFALSLLSLFS